MDAIQNRTDSVTNLSQHTIKSGGWVLLVRIIHWVLQFVRIIVLARILAPHDFGLFGIAFLLLSLLDTFSRTGLWEALIQKNDDIRQYLDTVWTLGVVRGAAIALVLFFSAPAIAAFFNAPEAEAMVKIIGWAMVFQGLSNIGVVYFDKSLEYHKYFLLMALTAVADLVVTLIVALIYKNAWALVAGCLAGALAGCIASYFLHPYRPKFSLQIKKAGNLFSYGKWIWGSSILVYLTTQADDFFVGKMLGIAALGFYQMAFRFSSLISTEIIFPLLKVTFPAYAKIREDIPRLKYAFQNVVKIIAFLVFFMAVLLFVLADNIVFTLLGETWAPIVIILRILIFSACCRAMQRAFIQLAKALGFPGIQTKAIFLQLIIFSIFIYPGALYLGTTGVALVVLIQNIVSLPWMLRMVLPKIDLPYNVFLLPIIKQGSAAIITGLLLFFIQQQLTQGVFSLCVEIFLAVFVYICISRLLCRDFFETWRA